jgi:hypothetical protein
MAGEGAPDFTVLLRRVREGEEDSAGQLFAMLYAELRFFGGLTTAEAAEVLGIAPRTVELDWKMAKTWLAQRLDHAH